MPTVVELSKGARKELVRVPGHVVQKLNAWIAVVETRGLRTARKIPGYHDEPLHGKRQGERSIRLTRSYRAIYTLSSTGAIEVVTVEEVNKHDY